MINSRTKGAVGEREFASLIHQHLSVKLIRNLEQSRSGGHDLMVEGDCPVSRALDRFAIECKRYGSVTPGLIAEWWAQTESQARSASKVSCLAYRANRQDWRCVVPLAAVNPAVPVGRLRLCRRPEHRGVRGHHPGIRQRTDCCKYATATP